MPQRVKYNISSYISIW